MKLNGIAKVVVVSLLGILSLWLISTLLFGTGGGITYNTRGYYGGGHMNMSIAVGNGGAIAYGLLLLIKVLFAVFVTALVAGIIVWIKNNIFTKEDIEVIRNTFKGNKPVTTKEVCVVCCKEMEASWKVCPHCGKEKEAEVKTAEVKQEEVKLEEVKQEEVIQEDVKQEDVKQEEVIQEEVKQEEVIQEEVKQEEVKETINAEKDKSVEKK
jgi:hypothetical protein